MRTIADLQVSPIGFGGNVFGWTAGEAASHQLLDAFTAQGGNLIDTADGYSFWAPGNSGGESESIIGSWLRKRGSREEVVLATKVSTKPDRRGLAASTIAAALTPHSSSSPTRTTRRTPGNRLQHTQPVTETTLASCRPKEDMRRHRWTTHRIDSTARSKELSMPDQEEDQDGLVENRKLTAIEDLKSQVDSSNARYLDWETSTQSIPVENSEPGVNPMVFVGHESASTLSQGLTPDIWDSPKAEIYQNDISTAVTTADSVMQTIVADAESARNHQEQVVGEKVEPDTTEANWGK